MAGMAGATGGASATGNATHNAGPGGSSGGGAGGSGPSSGYGGKVAAKVRPNIVFPDAISGNPRAEVEVRASPDGTIVGARLVRASGNPAWDQAVLRAIDKTDTLPKDTDGRVPSTLLLIFRPND